MSTTLDDFLSGPQLYKHRYKVTSRTFYRWREGGHFPAPDLMIRDRPYWRRQTVEDFERAGVVARTAQRAEQPVEQTAA